MPRSLIPAAGGAMPVSLAARLKPYGMPEGVDPLEWRKSAMARVNDLLDRAMNLITALDMMEVDADLEDGGDAEPWLGWPARGPSPYDSDDGDDRERDDSDDEDGGEAEPSLGAPERGGWYVSQEHWADGARGDHEREEVSEDEGAEDAAFL